jgi:hypothetical protein
VRDLHAALGHHLHEIPIRQPIRDVPAHAQLDDVGVEGPLAVNRVTGYRLRRSAPLQGQRILLDAPECTRTRPRISTISKTNSMMKNRTVPVTTTRTGLTDDRLIVRLANLR